MRVLLISTTKYRRLIASLDVVFGMCDLFLLKFDESHGLNRWLEKYDVIKIGEKANNEAAATFSSWRRKKQSFHTEKTLSRRVVFSCFVLTENFVWAAAVRSIEILLTERSKYRRPSGAIFSNDQNSMTRFQNKFFISSKQKRKSHRLTPYQGH